MNEKLIKKLLIFSGSIFFFLFSIFPFWIMGISSLRPDSENYAIPPSLLPQDWTLNHIIDLFDPEIFPFLVYLKNSFIVSFLSSIVVVFFSTFAAYSLVRYKFPLRVYARRLTLVIYLFGGVIVIVPLFRVFVSLNLYDNLLALVIAYTIQTIPVALYLLQNYFESLPPSIEEASVIDGCSPFQTIFYIVLPVSLPAITAAFFYTFIIAWNEYLYALVFLTTPLKFTLPLGLTDLFYSKHTIWGRMMAASFIMTLPLVGIFFLIERGFIQGLTAGGEKG